MILEVPITKAKGRVLSVDSKNITSDDLYNYVFMLGLKAILGRGMSKLDRKDYKTETEFFDAVEAVAKKQLDDLYAGTTRKVGGKSAAKGGKKSPEVTEALRLAKIHAKEQAKASGKIKISHVAASEWTKAAQAYFDADPDAWLAVARESLARTATAPIAGIDIVANLKTDPKKEAAAKKPKAEKAKTPVAAKGSKPKSKPANPAHGTNA